MRDLLRIHIFQFCAGVFALILGILSAYRPDGSISGFLASAFIACSAVLINFFLNKESWQTLAGWNGSYAAQEMWSNSLSGLARNSVKSAWLVTGVIAVVWFFVFPILSIPHALVISIVLGVVGSAILTKCLVWGYLYCFARRPTKSDLYDIHGNVIAHFNKGQVWRYHTRPHEKNSLLYIVRVDEFEGERVFHIFLDGLQLKNENLEGGFQLEMPHMPVNEYSLRHTVTKLEKNSEDLPDISEGYSVWRKEFVEGNAGVFTIPVSEAIQHIEYVATVGAA